MDLDIGRKMIVREIMSSPVLTVASDKNIVEAAKTMELGQVGAVIVTDAGGKPLGILTEHDIVARVVSRSSDPSRTRVDVVMTAPLLTVDPDTEITEAARMMSKYKIRRLGVVYKGELTGIVTSRDLLDVTPELFEILEQKARMEPEEETETPSLAGYCDRCGAWSESLSELEGEFLCEDCKIDREEESSAL